MRISDWSSDVCSSDLLFGTQLGGGTDINRAIAYSQSLISRPAESMFVLLSDLYEGGIRNEMLRRMAAMKNSGVQVVVLLRSEERRGGQACVSTCRSRWSRSH